MTRHTLFNILAILTNIGFYFAICEIQGVLLFSILMVINAILSIYVLSVPIISSFTEKLDSKFDLYGTRFFRVKKRIYYKNLKNVFLVYKNDTIHVFWDKIFYLERVSKIKNVTDVDKFFKLELQGDLDTYFKDKIKPVNNESLEKKIKTWSGCLTKEDERDKKITDIL